MIQDLIVATRTLTHCNWVSNA